MVYHLKKFQNLMKKGNVVNFDNLSDSSLQY